MRRSVVLVAFLVPLCARAQDGTYRHPDGYFELVPPGGWLAKETYNGMEFQAAFRAPEASEADPETAFRVLFVPLAPDADREGLAAQAADLAREVASGILSSESGRIETERAIQVDGRAAHEIEVTQTNDAGTAVRGRVVGTVGPSAVFFLIYYTPETGWARMEPVFARAVRSFRVVDARLAEETPSAEMASYEDPEGAFRISHPTNWIPQTTREGKSVRYHFVPKRSIQRGEDVHVLFMVQWFDAPGVARASLADSARDLKERMLQGDANLRLVGEGPVDLGTLPSIRFRFNRRPESGTQSIREDVYVACHGPRVYVLVAAAPDGQYPAHQDAFARIAQSFAIP